MSGDLDERLTGLVLSLMITIFAKHPPYEDGHLGHVTAEMRRLGAPTIRAIEYRGRMVALEGSHRLAACDYLGLTPLLLVERADDASADEFWDATLGRLPTYRMPAIAMSADIAA